MSRYSRPSYTSIGYPPWPRGVKTIVIACVAVFAVQIVAGRSFTEMFGLTPSDVLYHGHVWQLATYIFLHDPGNIFHILMNMLGLWMFGSDLELLWGTRQFVRFFFICGIGAGIIFTLLSRGDTLTIGASGAVYGVLLAFGVLFPDRIIYYIIFPIRAKYFVMIMGGLAFYASITASNNGVANLAHIGGMLCGYIYLRGFGVLHGGSRRVSRGFRSWYEEWKRNRLRRKFEVYYNQRHNDNDEKWRRWKN
jgi:membrane associated rhomboid family serine protease